MNCTCDCISLSEQAMAKVQAMQDAINLALVTIGVVGGALAFNLFVAWCTIH